jgi:hypothetical protein
LSPVCVQDEWNEEDEAGMFNTTHSLVGLVAARAVWPVGERRSPALWVGLIAANAPDMDSISLFWGPRVYRETHHLITHSFFFLPVGALVVAAIFLWWHCFWTVKVKREAPSLSFRPLFVSAAAAWLSHLIIDCLPAYPTQPFSPFFDLWIAGDILFFLDPWLDGGLFLILMVGWWWRLRQKRGRSVTDAGADAMLTGHDRKTAIAALFFFFVWILSAFGFRELAWRNTVRLDGKAPAALLPAPFWPGVWVRVDKKADERGVVWSSARVGPVQWLNGLSAEFLGSGRGDREDLPEAILSRSDPAVKNFLRFSRFPMVHVFPKEKDGSVWVVWSDAYLNHQLPLWPGQNTRSKPSPEQTPDVGGGREMHNFARLFVKIADGRVVRVGP